MVTSSLLEGGYPLFGEARAEYWNRFYKREETRKKERKKKKRRREGGMSTWKLKRRREEEKKEEKKIEEKRKKKRVKVGSDGRERERLFLRSGRCFAKYGRRI